MIQGENGISVYAKDLEQTRLRNGQYRAIVQNSSKYKRWIQSSSQWRVESQRQHIRPYQKIAKMASLEDIEARLETEYALSRSPDQITELTSNLITHLDTVEKGILEATTALSFDESFRVLDRADGIVASVSVLVTLPALVSGDQAVRDASALAKQRLRKRWDSRYRNISMFKVLSEVPAPTTESEMRLVKMTMNRFKSAGSTAGESGITELETIGNRIAQLETDFQQNYNQDVTRVWLSREELLGNDDTFIDSLVEKDSLFGVPLKRPEIAVAMKLCKLQSSRVKLKEGAQMKCMDTNSNILDEIVQLRHKAAIIAGYKNHAARMLSVKMAKDVATVESFMRDISVALKPRLESELASLSTYLEDSEVLTCADIGYCQNELKKSKYEVNDEQVRMYFPLERVISETLKIYEEIFNLIITQEQDGETWHPSVMKYRVFDCTSGIELGLMYFDLFPREGKYPHQCVFPLKPGVGSQNPAIAILGNLSAPTSSEPDPCLRFFEVVTFFHEFGHAVHAICTRAKFTRFAWAWTAVPWEAGVENDFLEAPSQMLENWCYDRRVLSRLSGKKVGNQIEVLPSDLVEKLVSIRYLNSGVRYINQILYSVFDLTIHSGPVKETASLWTSLSNQYGLPPPLPGTNPGASFIHPMVSY